MNKKLKIALIVLSCILILAIVLVIVLVVCTPKNITVRFYPNYDGALIHKKVERAASLIEAPDLNREGYKLEGWYKTKECEGSPVTFPIKLDSDTNFYAKWTAISFLESITAEYSGESILLGEQPDKSLLTVTAHYSDSTSNIVSSYATGTVDSTTTGVKDWEISYTEGGVTKTAIVAIKVVSGAVADMSIHFISPGNITSGDSVYIKAGDTDILIDAGSSAGCAASIQKYVNQYCTDGVLEYVIATHEDTDHISGFTYSLNSGGGIFERFKCETIIDFPLTSKSTGMLSTYIERRDAAVAAGANHYTALECYNNENGAQRVYELADGITMEILYHKYYEQKQSEANNNSVCVLFTQGDNHYLFTGDLEESGEKSLVENNPNLPEVELFKAGHHGSKNASNTVLLNVIKPKNIVVSCIAGDKYNFPQQEFIDRIANYTENVYVIGQRISSGSSGVYGDLNGNIVFSCIDGVIEIHGSNNDTILKDTDWFAANRTCPEAWL